MFAKTKPGWLLRALRTPGVQPNSYIFTAAIHACGKQKDADTAFRLLDIMRRRCRFRPSVPLHNSIIDLFANRGDTRAAIKQFDFLVAQKLTPTRITYNSVLASFVKNKDEAGAMAWLELLKSNGFKPTGVSYQTLLREAGRGA